MRLLFIRPSRCLCLLLSLSVFLNEAQADPWVAVGDVRTRHHILTLIDKGAINLPANAWPLMWNDIKQQLDNIDITSLNADDVWSYRYLKHELRKAMQPMSGYASFYKANNRSLTPAPNTEKSRSERKASVSLISNTLSLKLQGNHSQSPLDSDDTHFDGSFFAAAFGNWVVGAGKVDRWWGPSWHSGTVLSNNARPPSSLFIQRSNSNALSKQLPWTLTAFTSEFDEFDSNGEATLSGARLSAKPLRQLDIGVHKTVLENSLGHEISAQGYDWRLNLNAKIAQLALFNQVTERSFLSGSASPQTQTADIIGLEAGFAFLKTHHRIILERSKSDEAFSEHYNYVGRNIAYLPGSGGELTTLLGFHYFANGHQLEWFATKARVDIWEDELKYAQLAYRFPFGDNTLISLGAMHYMDEFKLADERIRAGNFIKLEYAF